MLTGTPIDGALLGHTLMLHWTKPIVFSAVGFSALQLHGQAAADHIALGGDDYRRRIPTFGASGLRQSERHSVDMIGVETGSVRASMKCIYDLGHHMTNL